MRLVLKIATLFIVHSQLCILAMANKSGRKVLATILEKNLYNLNLGQKTIGDLEDYVWNETNQAECRKKAEDQGLGPYIDLDSLVSLRKHLMNELDTSDRKYRQFYRLIFRHFNKNYGTDLINAEDMDCDDIIHHFKTALKIWYPKGAKSLPKDLQIKLGLSAPGAELIGSKLAAREVKRTAVRQSSFGIFMEGDLDDFPWNPETRKVCIEQSIRDGTGKLLGNDLFDFLRENDFMTTEVHLKALGMVYGHYNQKYGVDVIQQKDRDCEDELRVTHALLNACFPHGWVPDFVLEAMGL